MLLSVHAIKLNSSKASIIWIWIFQRFNLERITRIANHISFRFKIGHAYYQDGTICMSKRYKQIGTKHPLDEICGKVPISTTNVVRNLHI